ncbi:MAG TPA: carboxypeptidase-like regulatory domain-containing protein [Terriglobia bacterium]|nr:carboxypeptidase-like regulatory domain-containing protein [Terriglobia bacterium]
MQSERRRITRLGLVGFGLVAGLLLCSLRNPAAETNDVTTVNVLVKDAESNQPINQAHLTLQFRMPGKVRSKMISYSAKTNSQGRYKFTHIPKGTIRLLVTADRHQSYGKEIEIERDNQLIEVSLRKPQPLL